MLEQVNISWNETHWPAAGRHNLSSTKKSHHHRLVLSRSKIPPSDKAFIRSCVKFTEAKRRKLWPIKMMFPFQSHQNLWNTLTLGSLFSSAANVELVDSTVLQAVCWTEVASNGVKFELLKLCVELAHLIALETSVLFLFYSSHHQDIVFWDLKIKCIITMRQKKPDT